MSKRITTLRGKFLAYLRRCGKQEQLCAIEFTQQNGEAVQLQAPIVDIFKWQGSNYLLLDKGQLLRLDRVLRVNGTQAA